MQQDQNKTEGAPRSPEAAWNIIVKVTGQIGSDEAKALRVLIYIIFLENSGTTHRNRLRCWRKLWRWLVVPIGTRMADAVGSHPLFVFMHDTPANMDNLTPVVQAAQGRGWNPHILTGDGINVSSRVGNRVANCVSLRGLMAATNLRERYISLTRARSHYAALYSGFKSQGSQWTNVIRHHRTWIVTELALFMAASLGLRRLYAALQPSCVISTSDLWPFDHAVFAEARRRKIPSFVIQHGVAAGFWWPCVADKLLLWGNSTRNDLMKYGAPADRLAVCGMPSADHLLRQGQASSGAKPCNAVSSYVILSNTQGRSLYPDLYARYGLLLKAVVAATPATRWTVKLHPREDETFYRELLDGRFPNFSILPKSTSLAEAVMQADVACTLFSTAGMEAMIMRRPLVVFDVGPVIREYAWWPKSGGGVYVGSPEEMAEFVKKAASDGQFLSDLVAKQDQFLSENIANPGRAAEAVLDTIQEVMSNASPAIRGDVPVNPARVP
jgi:hypothetical protein